MTEAFRPTAAERAIGRELERWCRSRDLSLVELGRLVGCSNAKLSKLENALWPVAPGDVVAIGMACRIDDDERNALFDQATWTRRQRLLGADTVIFDAARDYIELEFEASLVRTFRIDLIPGLFQTPDYILASARADDPVRAEVTALQQISMRAARQERLTSKDPLRIEAVLTEAVIRTPFGGAKTMKAQLLHLLTLGELSNVTVQVVPFVAGAYPAPASPFNVLSFAHVLHDDVVYTENFQAGRYIESPEERAGYTLRFARLQDLALSPEASLELIAEVVGD
ncbi:helix-turn-helix domain-containing protein [Umezawaea endophytica]|uniref:Helix-turn-helix domain-containing protein n=1 Tax=Umezawaea endophytica TaxID=1654476 RepID=A0A9X2VU04_9PSEU|nr:helix-turn-helix transcriptional regulator [Umezawaea endophytica]MCS7482322.1 helix-turn-helix domain-containing protein [Umezawaea endophytica]